MLVAIRYAISSEPIAAGIVLATVVTLGAALHDHPWRTAAIAVLPGVGVSLARAPNDSFGHLVLVSLASPIVVIVAGLLVKGGGTLVHRPEPHDRAHVHER